MSDNPSDRKNSFWLSFQYLLLSVVSLLIIKLNIIHYGTEIFGVWLVLSSIWGFSASLDLGFGTAIVKFIAEYKNENTDTINKLVSSSFFIFIIMGLIIFLIGNIVAYAIYFSNPNIIKDSYREEFIHVFLVLGITFYVKYIIIYFNSIFEGLSNFVITSKISIIQSILLLFLVLITYLFSLSIVFLAYCYLSTAFVSLIYLVYLFKTKNGKYIIHPKYFDKLIVKKTVKFSFSVQTISIFNTLIDPSIKYIVSNYYSISIIPAYEIARKFASTISGLFFTTFKIILPKASSLVIVERDNFINNDLVKYGKFGITYSGVFFGILTLPLIIFINTIFDLDNVIVIYVILILPETINNYGFGLYNYLLGIGKASLLALIQFINLVSSITVLIVGFILLNNIFGFLGYFFSVLLANVIMIVFLKKNSNFNLLQYLLETRVYKLILLVILLVIALLLLKYSDIKEYFIFTGVSCLTLLIFGNDLIYNLKKISLKSKSL